MAIRILILQQSESNSLSLSYFTYWYSKHNVHVVQAHRNLTLRTLKKASIQFPMAGHFRGFGGATVRVVVPVVSLMQLQYQY